MQARPVIHAAALAATMLFAGAAFAQQVTNPGMSGSGAESGGTATPAMKARVESMKNKVEGEAHKVGSKLRGNHASGSDTDQAQSAHPMNKMSGMGRMGERNHSMHMNHETAGMGMNSASFRREMAKCTDNEDMNARADCARQAVASHGGSSAS